MDARPLQQNDKAGDRYAFYASPVGPRILSQANKIFEDFSTSKYVLYFILFVIEVLAVFWIGLRLVR